MTAPTLADFLLARIADDEAVAREAVDLSSGIGVTREWGWVRFWGSSERPKMPSSSSFYAGAPTPARVLAECEAKRRIVELHVCACPDPTCGDCGECSGLHHADPTPAPCDTLRLLALPHADHEDYDEGWRP